MTALQEELTLQYHDTLNPLLFNQTELKPIVRERLLSIGKLFAAFANIPETAIVDIVMTGGNANYNYTQYSDIDVHLETDMSKLPVVSTIMDDYFYDKKILWTYRHQGLTVMGYPVELYVANSDDPPKTDQGVYSLLDNHWIQIPTKLAVRDFNNDENLQRKIDEFKTEIEDILSGVQSNPVLKINRLKEKLHNMRTAGITTQGEFSDENLLYKELRNLGYIDKLNDYLQKKNITDLSLA